jgi:hypothetical protein
VNINSLSGSSSDHQIGLGKEMAVNDGDRPLPSRVAAFT